MIFYIFYEWPFESDFVNSIELFNELMNLVTLYHLICFTDFVPNTKVRYGIGFIQLYFIIIWISVHFFFLIRETIINGKRYFKEKFAKKATYRSIEKNEFVPFEPKHDLMKINDNTDLVNSF